MGEYSTNEYIKINRNKTRNPKFIVKFLLLTYSMQNEQYD
jgi:hypothetical protein